ncbi:uncharacterized protein [Rutidosis leptorrhynchoides]|uniref:uncharacterized protein n=1 Tax=Rutidosis leptorrhynchoides TaxID=125765 RepID=UPI003A99035A
MAINNKLFSGVEIGKDKVCISHLQYADDTIYFGEWSPQNIRNFIKLFKCFELNSGLKINYRKSNLFGIGVDHHEISFMAKCFECNTGSLPFNYLGLPIGANMKKLCSWQPIIDKFEKHLSDWKARLISLCGRSTLVKSVLNSLPLYFFSLYRAPPCVIDKLESPNTTIADRWICNGSSWGGNWEWVRSPRSRTSAEFDDLTAVLRGVCLVPDRSDSWRWEGSKFGVFTTKRLTTLIDTKTIIVGPNAVESLRNNLVPKKLITTAKLQPIMS